MDSIIEFLEKWDILGLTIAAIVSLIVSFTFKAIKNFVTMKRKPYNISRETISRTIYDNRQEGDISITVSYKGALFGESLTMIRVRLLNDGENDINFVTQCSKPLRIEVVDAEIVDAFVEPSTVDVETTLVNTQDGRYDLSWKLLKRDEYVDFVVIVKGKSFKSEQIQISIRAEGISRIKSPEYHVWPQLWPGLVALLLGGVMLWFAMPKEITFIPYIPQNIFWTGLWCLMIPAYIILVLIKRIRWERE